ncbi:proline dipeptidase [Clostridia bacterium]|nr:proline dipeptidase [Clostridia bacterium]
MNTTMQRRIQRVLGYMEQEGLEQIIVTSTPSVYYLTGLWVEPHERMLALYLSGTGDMTLFGNALFTIDRDACPFECVLHGDGENPVKQLASVVKPGKIGIDKFWPAKFLLGLLELRPDVRPCLGSAPVDNARMRKDVDEIVHMRHASAQNDKAIGAMISKLSEGITETALASFLADTYTELGADFPIGVQIVSFGANAADPHHMPDKSVLAAGDCALFDIFTPFSGYWCDMTRTVYFGGVSREEEKIYDLVRLANESAIAAIRPGIYLSEIDGAARRVISEAGYGEYFTHRLGHGAGLECHEPPDCSGTSDVMAEPGMIFSVEPGIYIPGKYGVRIEDLVLVTEIGCESLNAYPKTLTVI